MRKLKFLVAVMISACLPALAADTPPGVAEPVSAQPITIRMEVVQLTDELAAQLHDQVHLPKGYWKDKGHGKVLLTTEVLTMTGRDGLLFVGHKSPVVYYDPRATQFQIQYVDTGSKMDVKCKAEGSDSVHLEVRTELSLLVANRVSGVAPSSASYPQTEVFTSNVSAGHVRYDEGLIVSRSQGPAARRYLETLGVPTSAGSDNLVTLITIIRL